MTNDVSASALASSSFYLSTAAASARVFGILELQDLIAAAVVQGADSPVEAMTDIKNLRLTSKAWDDAVKESPTVQHLSFNKPIPEYRVRWLTKPEKARHGPSSDNLLQVCNVYSERILINPSQVTFNPIMRHLLLRFRVQLGSRPRGMDTIKIRLCSGQGSRSFWMAYSNCRVDPHLDPMDDYNVEVDLWKKLGREVCGQFICQPPVQRISVHYMSETDAFSHGYYKASTNIVCEGGVQVWHVLAGLLAFLNESGDLELDELCAPSTVEELQEGETDDCDEVDRDQSAFDDEEDDVQIIIDGQVDPETVILVIKEDGDEDHPVWEDEAGDSLL